MSNDIMSLSELMDLECARKQATVVHGDSRSCVLLSGGLDSVAAMYWTLDHYEDVRCISFDYGQPHRDAELAAAQRAARVARVPWVRLALADALLTGAGILGGVGPDATNKDGTNTANIPVRNVVFAAVAASRALTWWPVGAVNLIIGSCADDYAGFPDCRRQAVAAMMGCLTAASDRPVAVIAPWLDRNKRAIVRAFDGRPRVLDELRRSWSCYAGKGPCGVCTACVARARAFDGADEQEATPMTGGDPVRRGDPYQTPRSEA